MSIEIKALLVMAPLCLVAAAYALSQGDWGSAGFLALIEILVIILYRTEKRNRAQAEQGSKTSSLG